MNSYAPSPTRSLYMATRIVWYILGIIEFLLIFRFLLLLFSANPSSAFVNFIYTISQLFVYPFLNVFPATRINGGLLEGSILLAMIVYWFLALIIIKLFLIGRPVSTSQAEEKLEQEDN